MVTVTCDPPLIPVCVVTVTCDPPLIPVGVVTVLQRAVEDLTPDDLVVPGEGGGGCLGDVLVSSWMGPMLLSGESARGQAGQEAGQEAGCCLGGL